MKTSSIAILLLASGAAFANEAADDLSRSAPFAGGRTRAEVKAETMAAKQAGTLGTSQYTAGRTPEFKGERSRGERRYEAVQAARAHTIHQLY
ncbi:MAG: DUF4148 domain-containing protein [Burkholderiales bacterium]|nr:DUF4148 domain-containing protein [Burkholderiales bacterium]